MYPSPLYRPASCRSTIWLIHPWVESSPPCATGAPAITEDDSPPGGGPSSMSVSISVAPSFSKTRSRESLPVFEPLVSTYAKTKWPAGMSGVRQTSTSPIGLIWPRPKLPPVSRFAAAGVSLFSTSSTRHAPMPMDATEQATRRRRVAVRKTRVRDMDCSLLRRVGFRRRRSCQARRSRTFYEDGCNGRMWGRDTPRRPFGVTTDEDRDDRPIGCVFRTFGSSSRT